MLRTLDRKLRSPWVAVGIIVVFIAFIAGLAFGLPDSDEAAAQEIPTSQPPDLDKLVIPEDVTPIPVTVIREVTGGAATKTEMSEARKEFLNAPMGRALYFSRDDRVIYLPADVRIQGIVVSVSCPYDGDACPETPLYVLEKGEATITLDRHGDIVSDAYETDAPTAFPFLTEDRD